MGGGSSSSNIFKPVPMCPGMQREIDDDNNRINDLNNQINNLNQRISNEERIAANAYQNEEEKIHHLEEIISFDLGNTPFIEKHRNGKFYDYNYNLPDPDTPPQLDSVISEKLRTNDYNINSNTNLGLLSKIQYYNNYLYNYFIAFNEFFYAFDSNENIIHNELEPQIDYLKSTALSGGLNLTYVMLKKQNNILSQQTQDNSDAYSGDMQKIMYQNQKIDTLQLVNFWYFVTYFILLGIFVIFIFLYSQNISIIMKVIITILFVLYPFYITYFRQFITYYFSFVSAFMYGNPYSSFNKYTYSTANSIYLPSS